MNKQGMIGEMLERGQTVADDARKTAVRQVQDTTKAAVEQVLPGVTKSSDEKKEGKDKDFLKDLYGLDEEQVPPNEAEKKQKEIEEKKKLQQIRSTLHSHYFSSLTRPRRQERPVEKVEREEEEKKMENIEKEKKKPRSLSTQRAQQRVEKYPGASG